MSKSTATQRGARKGAGNAKSKFGPVEFSVSVKGEDLGTWDLSRKLSGFVVEVAKEFKVDAPHIFLAAVKCLALHRASDLMRGYATREEAEMALAKAERWDPSSDKPTRGVIIRRCVRQNKGNTTLPWMMTYDTVKAA